MALEEDLKMNKKLFMPFIAVAAFMVVACSKEDEKFSGKGKKVSFMVEAPSVADEETDSKVTFNKELFQDGSALKSSFKWEAGDSFNIFSFVTGTTEATSSHLNWGAFTTETAGAQAIFTGTIPGDYNGNDPLVAVFSKYTDWSTAPWKFEGNPRQKIKFNIPSEQDGTGINYSLFAATPTYSNGSFSFTSANSFRLKTALTYFKVPADATVVRITITAITTKDNAAMKIVSEGAANDIEVVANSTSTLAGGGNNVITIFNNNQVLSGNVYFASRGTAANATRGHLQLTFVFEKQDGTRATKVISLGTDSNIKNLTNGGVNFLGSVTFGATDFQ
jgi:hypothetical protein